MGGKYQTKKYFVEYLSGPETLQYLPLRRAKNFILSDEPAAGGAYNDSFQVTLFS